MQFGRRNTGARKLNVLEVQRIRKLYSEGATQRTLALEYSMSVVQIGRIVRGESWPTGAGARGLSPREADDVLKGLLEVQAQVTAAAELTPAPPEQAAQPRNPLDE